MIDSTSVAYEPIFGLRFEGAEFFLESVDQAEVTVVQRIHLAEIILFWCAFIRVSTFVVSEARKAVKPRKICNFSRDVNCVRQLDLSRIDTESLPPVVVLL